MEKKIIFAAQYAPDLALAWESWGYETCGILETENKSENQVEEMVREYKVAQKVNHLFSFGFSPILAKACHKNKVNYICWEVDCPNVTLWNHAVNSPYVFLFVFDRIQYAMLVESGLTNVWYLPLAACVNDFESSILKDSGKSASKYGSDVVFVGNLYNDDKHNLYDRITYLPPYVKGYLEALLQVQKRLIGPNILRETINESMWQTLRQYVKWDLKDEYIEDVYEMSFVSMLAQKLAQIERMEMCSYLAEHFDFALYTGCDTSFDSRIDNRGYADYLREMPLIFRYSKINIHSTMRSITSGISQRVFDVLACEGFLLTNYQPEIAEYFVDGEELVMYYSQEDMYEKIAYYLNHEEERKQIAHAGYLKVKQYFNYREGVGTIVECVEERNAKNTTCV